MGILYVCGADGHRGHESGGTDEGSGGAHEEEDSQHFASNTCVCALAAGAPYVFDGRVDNNSDDDDSDDGTTDRERRQGETWV